MSKVNVRQPHTVSRAEAKQRLEGFAELLKRYRVSLDWKGDKAAIKGVGVSGDIDIRDDAIQVSLQLGMLARAAGIDAARLEGSIGRRLREAFEG